jgi:glycosyltransferase involved in cell wall biosynthesis
MVSFQGKLAAGLEARGIEVCFDLNESPYDAVLVIGGIWQLPQLWGVKRKGIRIVQRLDGMNWVHNVLNTGWRHWLRSTYGNFILSSIRSSLADRIVYQSAFSQEWWERRRGITPCPSSVIHNGVDLESFSPGEERTSDGRSIRLLMVEGSLLGGYEFGLQNAVNIAANIAHSHHGEKEIELIVVGRVSNNIREHWDGWMEENAKNEPFIINWKGVVPHSLIVKVYRDADIFFSADVNAACPNSVIEAMACGSPVISFDTGALSELLNNGGGVVVPYGADPWKLERPDYYSMSEAAVRIIDDLDHYRKSARLRAEEAFDLNIMVDRYLDVLLG